MKALVEKEIGGDGAMAGVYVDGTSLALKVSYPLEKVVEPVAKVLDGLVDKLEKLIPGDQLAMAADAKAKVREELAELFAKQMGV